MKLVFQSSKYIKFLLFSTAISLSLFVLNVTVGFDSGTRILPGYKAAQDEEVVKGDIHPIHGSNQTPKLVEETDEYKQKQFWDSFTELAYKYSPTNYRLSMDRPESCTLETNLVDPIYDGELYSEKFLEPCLTLNYDDYMMLEKLHTEFVQKMPKDYGTKESPYKGRGIVMVGSDKYSLMDILVISILREQGTTLPIEVMIPWGSEDDDFCEKLTKYNAKCIRPIITKERWDLLGISGYLIKIVTLLSTSFEDLLYLDSDNYPLRNVDHIFDIEPYKKTGFISWPDFWRRSTSPAFFKIAGKKVGEVVRNNIDVFSPVSQYSTGKEDLYSEVSYHDRAGTIPDGSSETSVILINKVKHLRTLMLAFYYNLNGNRAYYHLLTQGNFGEGDKETFIAAAHVLDLPYYQVKTKPGIGGELLHGGKTPRGTSMMQFDPLIDYELFLELTQKFGKPAPDSVYDVNKVVAHFNEVNVKPLFLHYNLGKMDPMLLGILRQRRYGYDLKAIGFDFEMKNMELMYEFVCSDSVTGSKINFNYLERHDVSAICADIKDVVKTMAETSSRVVIN